MTKISIFIALIFLPVVVAGAVTHGVWTPFALACNIPWAGFGLFMLYKAYLEPLFKKK